MTSGSFIAEQFEQFRCGADERDASLIAGASESGILRKKSVSGVDGVYLFLSGHSNNPGDIEIGFDGTFSGTYFVGFVRFEAMKAEAVFMRVDSDRAEIELVGGAENANGDFAAVRSQESLNGTQFRGRGPGFCALLHKREYCSRSGG